MNEHTEGAEPSVGNGRGGETSDDVAPRHRPVDLLREEEKFSKKPVQQLAIVKEANILISLSDNYVSIYDLQSYAPQERLERTKGATSFAVMSNIVKDAATGIPSIVSRLAVAVKRKVILWSWQDMELSDEVVEISLIAAVKSLTWATGTRLVAGLDPGFVTVDIETREVADIVKPGSLGQGDAQAGIRFGAVNSAGMGYMGMGNWVPKPMATKLNEGEMLLAKDVNSLFIDAEGKPLDKRQIPWSSAPEAIGYSYPYMLALLPPARGTLEVRNPDTLSLLQSVALPNATFLHVPQPHISLAHAGKGFLVASDRCVWRMGGIKYDSQIEELISHARYDEGISLLNLLEDALLKDKEGKLREIKTLKAQNLFQQRKYREALELFSNASAPPAEVISLYPRSIAADFSSIEPLEDPQSLTEQDSKSDKGSVKESSPTPTPHGSLTRGMLSRLRREKKADEDKASVKSSKGTETSDAASIRSKVPGSVDSLDKPLEGRDLTIAINELCAFLAQTRVQLQRILDKDGTLKQPLPPPNERPKGYVPPFHHFIVVDPEDDDVDWEKKIVEVAALVDTTLFRAYMITRPGLAGSLFRIDNFCDPEVVNEKLYETGRYAELIDFLHGKKLHREALELLAKFGKADEAEESSTQSLRGPQRTVGYLQQLPPELIDLILEFAEWPLQADPALGMEVFVADTKNAEELDRYRVLEFLHRIDTKLSVQYLGHIINELNDLTPEFHQRLIDLYLERLKDFDGDFATTEDRKEYLASLLSFLKSSSQYNLARVFSKLPADDPEFFECRATVLSKMGQHKQALQIYVFHLHDDAKAEEYCNTVYLQRAQEAALAGAKPSIFNPFLPPQPDEREDAPEASIYNTLLSLYLSPPPPHKPNLAPALALLAKHGARVPASSTLSLVPATLPVRQLESYFRGRLRAAVSAMREDAVVARLAAVQKADAEAKLLLQERNRRVVVSEERVCGVCHKRFGGSAIRVYPDGAVVHYGCLQGRARGGSFGKGDGGSWRKGWS